MKNITPAHVVNMIPSNPQLDQIEIVLAIKLRESFRELEEPLYLETRILIPKLTDFEQFENNKKEIKTIEDRNKNLINKMDRFDFENIEDSFLCRKNE